MISRIHWLCLILATGCSLSSGTSYRPLGPETGPDHGDRVEDPRTLEFADIDFTPRRSERVMLDNGMVVHLVHSDRLPLVAVQMWFPSGAAYEESGQTGLASITGQLLRTGGAGDMTPEEVDLRIDDLAAQMSISMDDDHGSASINVHRKNLDEALDLLGVMLSEPGFDQERLDEALEKAREGIRRENDYPVSIAFREFNKALHGEDHPKARTPTFASIDAINRESVAAFHDAYMRPDGAIIGIAGSFDRDTILDQLTRAFAGWAPRGEELSRPSRTQRTGEASRHLAQKEVTQSTVVMGHVMVDETHPDRYALELLNTILGGGGFTSRLVTTIRSDRGLAYSTGTFMQFGLTYAGTFAGYAMTKGDATGEVIELMRSEIEKIRAEGVTPEELALAKNMKTNSIVFDFASSEQIARRAVRLEFHGLPADHAERALDGITSVGLDDIQRAAQNHLDPDGLRMVVVGDTAAFGTELPGEWTAIDLESQREM